MCLARLQAYPMTRSQYRTTVAASLTLALVLLICLGLGSGADLANASIPIESPEPNVPLVRPGSWSEMQPLKFEIEEDPLASLTEELAKATQPARPARKGWKKLIRKRQRNSRREDRPPRADDSRDNILSRGWYRGVGVDMDTDVALNVGVQPRRRLTAGSDGGRGKGAGASESKMDVEPFVGVTLRRLDLGETLSSWLP